MPLKLASPQETTFISTSQARYPALDGLRAVAALMVFFHHYAASRFAVFGWGWTGVDIFFVLSGFLITGVLYDSRNKPSRYRDFYIRRALRIFPVYYFVWLAILLAAPIARWQWDWHFGLWPVYLGNYIPFFLLHNGDPNGFQVLPFGAAVDHWFGRPMNLPVGHFWSLCVEEQFYFVWPLIVYQVGRRATLIRICIGTILVMPLARWLLAATLPAETLKAAFLPIILPTKLDALLAGALVALWLRGPESDLVRRWRRFALLGAVALMLAGYVLPARLGYPSVHGTVSDWRIYGMTLIAILGGALIANCIHPGGLLATALSLKPLRMLGRVSYGFYVYHWLFRSFYFWFGERFVPRHAFAATIVAALAGTCGIAALSYRFLEQPLLRLKSRFIGQVHTAPVT